MTEPQVEELLDFIRATRDNRCMPYVKLAQVLDFAVSQHVIRRELEKRGYHRRITIRKPPITETNRVKRLHWAIEHVNWIRADWNKILWTGKTWITAGIHTRTWVTHRPGEEWDDTCIVEREQLKKRLDVLGQFSRQYTWSTSILGEGLG